MNDDNQPRAPKSGGLIEFLKRDPKLAASAAAVGASTLLGMAVTGTLAGGIIGGLMGVGCDMLINFIRQQAGDHEQQVWRLGGENDAAPLVIEKRKAWIGGIVGGLAIMLQSTPDVALAVVVRDTVRRTLENAGEAYPAARDDTAGRRREQPVRHNNNDDRFVL